MTRHLRVIAALPALAALLGGCGRSEPDQTTPAGTAAKLVNAEFALNTDAYLACVADDDQQESALKAYIDYIRTAYSFRTLVELQYGQEGWEEFAPGAAGITWLPPNRAGQLDDLHVDVQGDSAEVVFPDGLTLHMVRDDGLWYVKAEDLLPKDRSAKAAARMYTRLVAMLQANADRARDRYPVKALGREVGNQAHQIKNAR